MTEDEIIKEYHEFGLETIMSERLYLEWYVKNPPLTNPQGVNHQQSTEE